MLFFLAVFKKASFVQNFDYANKFTRDLAFRWVNQSFLDTFGYDEESEVTKLSFADILADEPLQPLFAQAYAGEPGALCLHAEGDEGSEDVEVRLAPDVHGKKITGVVGSVIRV